MDIRIYTDFYINIRLWDFHEIALDKPVFLNSLDHRESAPDGKCNLIITLYTSHNFEAISMSEGVHFL